MLGDSTQRKSYLYIQDCLSAMLHFAHLNLAAKAQHRAEVFNLGLPEYCQVKDSIGWIGEALNLQPRLDFTGGDRGWIGDNPSSSSTRKNFSPPAGESN